MSKLNSLEVTEFLIDGEQHSEVSFLEEGKEKKDLIESAKKRGILIEGSKDLGIIKTVFLFADKANVNGAILPKKELLQKLPQIVGKPMNIGHQRELIVGFYIDYKFIHKDNKAIAYAIFFKNIYSDLWKKAKSLKKKNKLSSSFEIWSPMNKRKVNLDGTFELHQMEMAGGALIFEENGESPAFKDAKVLEIAKKAIATTVNEDCLVCASKYKNEELITSGESIFKDSVEENLKKIQNEKIPSEKKVEPKAEKKVQPKIKEKEEVKSPKLEDKKEVPPVKEEIKEPPKPEPKAVACSNCLEKIQHDGISQQINCPKCFAILNAEGIIQYPPQIKNFQVSCPSCKIGNWLIVKRDENEALIKCQSCSKDYNITFEKEIKDKDNLIKKINFVYRGTANCPQCHQLTTFSGVSILKDRTLKCGNCGINFPVNVSHESYRKILEITPVTVPQKSSDNKLEKSKEEGGQKMELKLELSKFHRYSDDIESVEKSLVNTDTLEESVKAKILTTEQRNALPDNLFAVVVRVKNKRTGKMRKIRMFPINDEAHVRNALGRLGQKAPQATLKRLGVSVEKVRAKILRRARQLKMTDLLKRQESKSKSEATKAPEAKKVEAYVKVVVDVKNLEAVKTELQNAKIKEEKLKAGVNKIVKQVITIKKELEQAKEEKKLYEANAKEILTRREQLGSYADKMTDEQILDDKDFEIAKLKKEVDLQEPEKIETASESVGDKKRGNDYYKSIQSKVNATAFPENKNKDN